MIRVPRSPFAFAAALATLTLTFAAPAAAQDAGREAAVEALEQVEALAEGQGVRTGRELSPALATLASRRSDLSRSQRREANALLARPTDPNDNGPGALGSYTAPSGSSCSTNFCVHWVESGDDAPSGPGVGGDLDTVPQYVETVKTAFEQSFAVENTQLGWRTAVPDNGRGGDNRTDVYLQNIGTEGIFGYASTDPQPAGRSQYAYLVVDDDYEEFGYSDPQDPLEVTAAHEYNHVLQYAYDTLQDTWMFESTATWSEEKVFDAVNDYLFYLRPWAADPDQPLTDAGAGPEHTNDLRMYGSAIWNQWLDGRYGPQIVRQAWTVSVANSKDGGGFAPSAYDRAIRDTCGPGLAYEFEEFTAAVAEWDAANSGIREGVTFPDEVAERGALTPNGASATGTLDHTAFALYNVPPTAAPRLYLTGGLPAGTAGSIALVGYAAGTMTRSLGVLDANGKVTVALDQPGRFERITAVVTNADTSAGTFGANDWTWTKDNQAFTLTARDTAPSEPAAGPLPSFTPCPPVTPGPQPTATPAAAPTTTPTPAPIPVATATSVRLARSSTRLKTVARRGVLSFLATVNKAGRLTATATVDKATAKRLKIGRRAVRIGTGGRTASRAQTIKVNVRLSRKVRAALKRQKRALTVKVRTRFVPSGGGAAVTRTISLRLKP